MIFIKANATNAEGKETVVEVGISFIHNTANVNEAKHSGFTFCDITVNGQRVATGRAVCTLEDNFNKAIGRKVALKRALEDFYNTFIVHKDMRKTIWKNYFDQMK